MSSLLIPYFLTLVIFLVIDALWLGVIAKNFYMGQLGHLMLDEPKLGIAFAFYCVYVVGIVIFAVHPALQNGQWTHALIYGALFGFFCYATYDLTNMATLKDWPTKMSLVDMIWGPVLTGGSAVLGFFASRAIMS